MQPEPGFFQALVPLVIDILRLGAWLILLLAVFVPIERRWPIHPQKFFRKAFGTDLLYYFLSALIPKLLLILPVALLAGAIHRAIGGGAYYNWIAGVPLWVRFLPATVVGEIGSYWGHRWMHEVPFLWRFHAIHHKAEEMDWLVNSRVHPVDQFFTRFCGLIPMYLLGLANPKGHTLDLLPVLVTIAGTIWGFFIHANVNWRFGWLEWVVSSPAFHHWHHTNDGPQLINKNYAAMLPLVDKLFGTFYLPKAQWPEKYGTDTAIASGVAGQLLSPLVPTSLLQPSTSAHI